MAIAITAKDMAHHIVECGKCRMNLDTEIKALAIFNATTPNFVPNVDEKRVIQDAIINAHK